MWKKRSAIFGTEGSVKINLGDVIHTLEITVRHTWSMGNAKTQHVNKGTQKIVRTDKMNGVKEKAFWNFYILTLNTDHQDRKLKK